MPDRRLLLITPALFATQVFAADLDSRIEAVTLYPNGALVTRVASVQLPIGESELRLTGLVQDIEPEYLQVEVSDPDVRIGQVRLVEAQERDAVNEAIQAVEAKILELRDSHRALTDSTIAAQRRLKFLDSLAEGAAQDDRNSGASPSVAKLSATLDLLQSESEEASSLIRSNEAKKVELQKDLSVLDRELASLNGGSLATSVAEVTVTSQRATAADIRLVYYQDNAHWQPIYEARLDSNSGSLELSQQARVEQDTDEPWNNVALTLSTSQPSGELIAPTVESEFLDIVEPPQFRANAGVAMDSLKRMDSSALEQVVVTGARRSNVGDFAVNYPVPGRTTVSNDSDDAITLDLERFRFDTELVTRVAPRESTQAFLTARFTYTDTVPLYGSEMRVYVDGVFAGLSQMPTALPQAEVVLPMGQDRRVEVKSEIQGGEGGSRGVIGKRKSEVTDYVFELTNRRSKASVIEVLDRIPVARNRDIDVDVPRSATPPTERDVEDQPGLVIWRETVDAGAAWRIRHQYTVSYPEKYRLIRQN